MLRRCCVRLYADPRRVMNRKSQTVALLPTDQDRQAYGSSVDYPASATPSSSTTSRQARHLHASPLVSATLRPPRRSSLKRSQREYLEFYQATDRRDTSHVAVFRQTSKSDHF